MTHPYIYTNANLNSPLQQKGNGNLPSIEWTPLKTNTPTITANKVNSATAGNAIAASIEKISEKKKKKITKEKEDKVCVCVSGLRLQMGYCNA
jgi:hypothetical protein